MSRASAIATLTLLCLGCQPSDPCDPGYYHDHGACYPLPAGLDAGPLLDAGGLTDGAAGDPTGAFGRLCHAAQDCGGEAPLCGAPYLPYCTAPGCAGMPNACPPRWTCLDVHEVSPIPNVTSVCLRP